MRQSFSTRDPRRHFTGKDLWEAIVDNAMADLIWATGGVDQEDPMVPAWQALRDAIKVSGAHQAWLATQPFLKFDADLEKARTEILEILHNV